MTLVPLGNFLAHEVKWKTEPEPGLERGFSSFHPLCTSASSFSLARTLFSVSLSVSVGFPLSIYCYTLAKSAASRIQGDSIIQGSGSREFEGMCHSRSCTDSSLCINHCTYLLRTGASMSIWRERADVKTNNALWKSLDLPSKLLPSGRPFVESRAQNMRTEERLSIWSNRDSFIVLSLTVGLPSQQCWALIILSNIILGLFY